MRPLKDSERLASSYMYESGGKKRHCSETADQTGELYEESRIYRFFKTDSSEKPHMHANKNHIFKLHMVLWDFFFICWEASRNCVGYRGIVICTSEL